VARIVQLTRDEVRAALPDVQTQIALVEKTYAAMARGRVELPPKPGIHPRPDAFIHAMPAYLHDDDVAAIKWVSGYPSNKAKGLPYINGLIIVNDAGTGIPVAIMDAGEITAARTAAASAACIRQWARAGWQRVAIIGCGEQGRYHARIVRALNPSTEIAVYDPDPKRMAEMPQPVVGYDSALEAVTGADVVVSLAPIIQPAAPIIRRDWLGECYLALPADFDATFQPDVTGAADIFVADDLAQYFYYRDQGHFDNWRPPDASVGEAMLQSQRGRTVVCCNLGVAALDAAFAAVVLESLRSRE
jgi:ornithine cyclodeaminase/alanine dehydrogenase